MARKTGVSGRNRRIIIPPPSVVWFGNLQHLPLTSESEADRVNNPLVRLLVLGEVAWRIYGNVAPIEETSLQEFREQIETNLFGVIIMTKAVLPYFRERKAGKIFQISSIGGRIGPIGRAPYAAA